MITATRTFDADTIRAVLLAPEIYATIAEDGHERSLDPDLRDTLWLEMRDEHELVAVYQLERINGITAQIHANVLKKHRKKYSRATGEAALQWVVENLPEINKIIAVVPVIYPNVKDFTCGFGFQVEGVNRQSYLKNGEIHDQWLLGITRAEIGENK